MVNASLALSVLLSFLGSPKLDSDLKTAVEARVAIVESWAADPVIVESVREANRTPYSMEEIEKLDQKWQATHGTDDFMKRLMANAGSRRLRELKGSHGELQEAFLTDRLGANVSCTNKTSDFYQGDEDKFQVAFADGQGGLFLGELSRDESIQSYSVQIGVPVMDAGEAIGVLVVTVNVEKLKSAMTAR